MTKRIIDSSMWQNEKFTELPICARLLQVNLINFADDQGRAKATPKYLKVQVFPFDDIPLEDIQAWLESIQANGTIILYTVDGKQYAQFTNWWKYQTLQYAQPSQHPRPEGWQDRIRRTHTKGSIVTCNWHTVDGALVQDTCDQDGNPLPRQQTKAVPSPKTPTPTPEPATVDSPGHSPGHSPESTGEDIRLRSMRTKDDDDHPIETSKTNVEQNGRRRHRQPLPEKPTDPAYTEVKARWQKANLGRMDAETEKMLKGLWAKYDHAGFDQAIAACLKANKTTLSYLEGVLKNFLVEGVGGWKANGSKPPSGPKLPAPDIPDYILKIQQGIGK